MFRSLICCVVLASATFCLAQWQTSNQVDGRTQPVYPTRPYTFQSVPSNYDPFQFNWHTGRWDYVPIPYDSVGPYQFNPQSGDWRYLPWNVPNEAQTGGAAGPSQSISPGPIQSNAPAAAAQGPGSSAGDRTVIPYRRPTTRPDDSDLWETPTTQPHEEEAKEVKFEGRLMHIRAISLVGQSRPILLLRLKSAAGANASVALPDRLDLSTIAGDLGSKTPMTVSGKLGQIDGCPVIFADHLQVGSQPVELNHPTTTPVK